MVSGTPGKLPHSRKLTGAEHNYDIGNHDLKGDVAHAVKSCSVCAVTKVPRTLPASKLLPLPILQRLWSHIAVDFVTNLPESKGYTTILVVEVLKGGVLSSILSAARSLPISGNSVPVGVSVLWHPWGHPVWPGTPLHVQGLDHVFQDVGLLRQTECVPE